jgi:hypothetical protein
VHPKDSNSQNGSPVAQPNGGIPTPNTPPPAPPGTPSSAGHADESAAQAND